MIHADLRDKLIELFQDRVRFDCSLSRYTTFGIGGPAGAFVDVDNVEELQQLLAFCHQQSIPWRMIGGGSNLLIHDDGYDGIIVHLGKGFKKIEVKEAGFADRVILEVGSAFGFSKLSEWCSERGFTGFEFAYGIPGSLGGALVMNAGAWGVEIGDLVIAIELVDRKGILVVEKEELHFDYRCLKNIQRSEDKQVVVKAHFALQEGSAEQIRERCRQIRQQRELSQPHGKRTCGSFFKNPPNDSAGRLIDRCGLKGTRVGGAMISEKHANFFINTGTATAADMIRLMELVQQKVKTSFNILLEPEVHFLP